MSEREDKVMKRLQEHYDYLIDKGHEVVFVAHQGSYNYDLDYEKSDIDSKAIILPNFSDFALAKTPLSYTYILDNEEHIDTKDIRVMCEMWQKENLSYIELLYTDFIIINPKYKEQVDYLRENRDKIVDINPDQFLRCIAGMSKEKVKALCHPYPSIKDKIDKWGFDGKQLSHCIRLNEFINRYTRGIPIANCFHSKIEEQLIRLKQNLDPFYDGYLDVDVAIELCDFYDDWTYKVEQENLGKKQAHPEYKAKYLDNFQCTLLKQYLKEQLLNDY